MNRWALMAVALAAALLCGCGRKSVGKAGAEWEDEVEAADGQTETVEAGKEATVTAIVEAAGTDDEGKTTAVGLWEEANSKWYTVGEGGKGKEMFKLVGKTVKATGTVKEDERGGKTITVVKYEVVGAENR